MRLLDDLLDDLVDVADDEISDAITLLLERSKLLVEGAGAAAVAALLAGKAGGDGPRLRGDLGWEHRSDDPDLGPAARPYRRRPLPRSCGRGSTTARAS